MAIKKGLLIYPLDLLWILRIFLAGPVVSDNGNFIIDAPFSREIMEDPFTVGPFPQLE